MEVGVRHAVRSAPIPSAGYLNAQPAMPREGSVTIKRNFWDGRHGGGFPNPPPREHAPAVGCGCEPHRGRRSV